MHHLLYIPLLFAVGLGTQVAFSPPRPTSSKEEEKSPKFKSMHIGMSIFKYSCWAHAAIETSIISTWIVAQKIPGLAISSRIHELLFNALGVRKGMQNQLVYFTPLRMAGALLILAGAIIRYISYRELGKQFIFHVAILKDHELIKTGPYSIVRHPGYTAGLLISVGSVLWYATAGAWLVESAVYKNMLSWALLAPSIITLCTSFVMGFLRAREEDELLRKEFGGEWEQWAQAVPCRLLPGVY